jgi:hypothetical protein
MNATSQSAVRIVGIAVLKGAVISVAMAVAAYLFLKLFSGITESTRLTASLVFLIFGLVATVIIGVNAHLSRKSSTTSDK